MMGHFKCLIYGVLMNKLIILSLALFVSLNSHATLLIKAVKNNHPLMVRSLLLAGTNVDEISQYGSTALIAAAASGNVKISNILLSHNANPDLADTSGATPLLHAVLQEYPDMVENLLKWKANPNIADGAGQTPLLISCLETNTKIDQLLIAAGANPNILDVQKRSPLMAAAFNKKTETFYLLLSKGADVKARDKAQKSVLAYAGETDEFKTALLEKGAIPYRIDEMNFLWDILFSDENKKAFIDYRNELGENHLIMAIKSKATLAINPLLTIGLDKNIQDHSGKTPLHWATLQNNLEIVTDLIDAKVKLKLVDQEGFSAIDYAIMEGHLDIAAILAIAILEEELENN